MELANLILNTSCCYKVSRIWWMEDIYNQNVIIVCATALCPSSWRPPTRPWWRSAWAWSRRSCGGRTPGCARPRPATCPRTWASRPCWPESPGRRTGRVRAQGFGHCRAPLHLEIVGLVFSQNKNYEGIFVVKSAFAFKIFCEENEKVHWFNIFQSELNNGSNNRDEN